MVKRRFFINIRISLLYSIVFFCAACGFDGVRNDNAYRVKLSFTGDIMLHGPQAEAAYDAQSGAYDFTYCFKHIKKYFEDSDLTIGNLETTFSNFFNDYPSFSAPDAFADALSGAGFGLLSTANNHCYDYGYGGLARTLDTLDRAGIGRVGTNKTQIERDNLLVMVINHIKFIFLAYTYGVNTFIPGERSYSVNLLDDYLMAGQIEEAKALNPDVIVVLAHMGGEYTDEPSAQAAYWAEFMLSCGADIVVACHPHAVQRVEISEAGVIAYSMGNFLSSQRTPPNDYGMILNMEFIKRRGRASLDKISYIPTWVKFYRDNGTYDIQVLSVYDAIEDYYSDNIYKIKRRDIGRLRDINGEITRKLSGAAEMPRPEYVIYEKTLE